MELAMLFNALLFLGIAGYVIFRIARRFYRWAMGRPVEPLNFQPLDQHMDMDFLKKYSKDQDWDRELGSDLDEITDPSYNFLPQNIFHKNL